MRIIRNTISVVFCSLILSCNQSNTISLNHYRLEQILEASYDDRDTLYHHTGAIKQIVLKDSVYSDPGHYDEANYRLLKEINIQFSEEKYPISIAFEHIEVLERLDQHTGIKDRQYLRTVDSTRCFVVNRKKSIAAILIEP